MTKFKELSFQQKIEHIWFYYKWYIIIGGLLAAFTVIACAQCANRVEADMNIMFVTGQENTKFNDVSCTEIQYFVRREYATDINSDGETSVKYFGYKVANEIKKTDVTTLQAMMTSIYGAESFLIICDEAGFKHLQSIGSEGTPVDVLEPLKNVVPDAEIMADGYRISLKGTALGELKSINETGEEQELFACIRLYSGSKEESNKAATKRYEAACEILKKILADKAE